MLILCRKKGQQIYISPKRGLEKETLGDLFIEGNIVIEVLKIEKQQVKLGFNASDSFQIVRDDVVKQPHPKENKNNRFRKLCSLGFWKNEAIFFMALSFSMILLSSVNSTGYAGLIGSLVVLVGAAIYYSLGFFRGQQSFEKLYFYVCIMPFILLYFALIYRAYGLIPPGSEEVVTQLSWTDAYYFSVVTWTTLGFGDFRPGNDIVKLWVIAEVLLGYLYMGIFIGKLLLLGTNKISAHSNLNSREVSGSTPS